MSMSYQYCVKTKSIGSIASEIIAKDQDASVFGVTSKGMYIKTSSKWLVYLSFEAFQGPLTITIAENHSTLQQLSARDPIYISSKSILFPRLDIMIDAGGNNLWQPPSPSSDLANDSACHIRLVCFAREAMLRKSDHGFNPLLSQLLGLTTTNPETIFKQDLGWTDIVQIQKIFRNGDSTSLANMLSSMLGKGQGLTPAADDFIAGLLLSMNRWPIPPWTANQLEDLNHKITNAAYERTTTLSANLIECATLGQADVRLINALDWMVTGVAQEPEIASHLSEWGDTSGVNAFLGMAVMLTV
jgi:hypothetical protein